MQAVVLLAEGDADIRRAHEAFLQAAGFQPVGAATGAEALQRAAARPPDVVVMGAKLADLDAATLCRRLHERRETATVPVIVVARTEDLSPGQRARVEGAAELLQPAFTPDQLIDAISRAVTVSQQLRGRSQSVLGNAARIREKWDNQIGRAKELAARSERLFEVASHHRSDAFAPEGPPDAIATPSPANRLLAAIPREEFDRIAAELEAVELRRRHATWSFGDRLQHVYFPESGAVALVMASAEGGLLETGLVGQEGLLGLEAFFDMPTARQQALVMLPGVAQRLTVEAFGRLCVPGTALYQVVRRHACTRMASVAQSALCDATHSIRQRCVRRLLVLHDCARADHFPLTQQVLAALLGVRRASVSVAAEALQASGLILYEHGRMHIANRAGLEQAACGCYRLMKQEVDGPSLVAAH